MSPTSLQVGRSAVYQPNPHSSKGAIYHTTGGQDNRVECTLFWSIESSILPQEYVTCGIPMQSNHYQIPKPCCCNLYVVYPSVDIYH